MRTIKTAIVLIGALVPIVYWGGLAVHFFTVGGSAEGVRDIGLGPTVIGLGVIALLFCIPLVLKVVRLSRGPRTPGSGPDTSARDDENAIDADAAIARYLAERSAETIPTRPAQPSGYKGSGPAKRTGFGRRTS